MGDELKWPSAMDKNYNDVKKVQNKIPSRESKKQQNKKECKETVMLLVTNKQFKFIVKMIQHLHRTSNISRNV